MGKYSGCLMVLLCILLVLLIVGIIVGEIAVNSHEVEYVATVTDKDRIVSGDSSYYIVFVKLDNGDVRVFKNADSLWRGKWDSSNVQASIEVGKTYRFSVYGYRVPFMSWYENIYNLTVVE